MVDCASSKPDSDCGVHVINCAPWIPLILSSRGDRRKEYRGKHREIALNAPINDFIAVHVLGLFTEDRADIS